MKKTFEDFLNQVKAKQINEEVTIDSFTPDSTFVFLQPRQAKTPDGEISVIPGVEYRVIGTDDVWVKASKLPDGEEVTFDIDTIFDNVLINGTTFEAKKEKKKPFKFTYLIEDEDEKRRVVYSNKELKVKDNVKDHDGKARIITKIISKKNYTKDIMNETHNDDWSYMGMRFALDSDHKSVLVYFNYDGWESKDDMLKDIDLFMNGQQEYIKNNINEFAEKHHFEIDWNFAPKKVSEHEIRLAIKNPSIGEDQKMEIINITKISDFKSLNERIKEEDGEFVVYPKNGGKRLGTHKTRKGALKQLAAIEISKHK